MAQILPRISTKRGDFQGNLVIVSYPDLSAFPQTFLSADIVAGETVIPVLNGNLFSGTDFVIIGELGEQESELRTQSNDGDDSIEISSGTKYAHSRGTSVRMMPFDTVTIEDAADESFTGSSQTAFTLDPAKSPITYLDTDANISQIYRAWFQNSDTLAVSEYSDIATGSGFADNSAYSIKHRALESVGEELGKPAWLTDAWLNNVLNEGRRELESVIPHWSFRRKFDEVVDTVTPGKNLVTVPADLREPSTAKNILALRIGNEPPMTYISKQEMNVYYEGVAHTTLYTLANTGDVTLDLTYSGDFDESGNVLIGGSDALDTVTYTANDEATGTLSGVTGIQAAGHAAGVDVWQHADFGLPTAFTVTDDGIMVNYPFDDIYLDDPIYMDYWGSMTPITSDADLLDEPDYDMFVNYLAYRIKKRKAGGTLNMEDDDYKQWLMRSAKLLSRERNEQDVYFAPDIAHLYEK